MVNANNDTSTYMTAYGRAAMVLMCGDNYDDTYRQTT